MNMYIGNLNYRVKEEDLGQFLSAYGTVSSVKIIRDRETGKSKGYGFVEMDDQSAAKILDELNGTEFAGRQLVLKHAVIKSNNPNRP
ncbi:RNA-binding protein [Bacteroides ilei]|uniref:RNA recognition motif domain-containing protein n=1 Tax=Bacteroides ilei TaxID=1907658 RepID=UPI0009316CD0|nr:RNA-binding protein [Bacteroides ilei]